MRFKESIVINRPIDEVFTQWADVEKYAEWAAPVVERRKLTTGPIGPGTGFHAVDQWPGRKAEFEMEITEFEENRRLGARWFKPMEGRWSSQLTEKSAGTQLDFEIEMQLPLMMRLFSPFLKRWVKKQNRAFMESFKARVEGSRGNK